MSASTRSASRFRTCWCCSVRGRDLPQGRHTGHLRRPSAGRRGADAAGPGRRARLGIDQNARVLAILPGSRSSEIRLLAPRFLQAAQILQKRDPALLCIVPMVNEQRRAEFQSFLEQYPVPGLRCVTAQDLHGEGGERQAPVAWSVMEASTAVLVASAPPRWRRRCTSVPWSSPTCCRRGCGASWPGNPARNALSALGRTAQRAAARLRGAGAAAGRRHAGKAGRGDLDGSDRRSPGRAHRARFTALHQDLLRDTPALAARASSRSPTVQPDLFGATPQPEQITAGVDEAGRGPLAGAVYAAAVILDPARPIEGLADSKALAGAARSAGAGDPRARAGLVHRQRQRPGDRQPEHPARHHVGDAARGAGLSVAPQLALVDGNQAPKLGCTVQTVIKGDALVPAISAASILAKTARDADLLRLHEQYPQYAFDQHKGYGTALHLRLLREHGPCAEHRRSFAPSRPSAPTHETHQFPRQPGRQGAGQAGRAGGAPWRVCLAGRRASVPGLAGPSWPAGAGGVRCRASGPARTRGPGRRAAVRALPGAGRAPDAIAGQRGERAGRGLRGRAAGAGLAGCRGRELRAVRPHPGSGQCRHLLRTCAAAGIKRVFLATGTAAAWSPKVLRSGQGAHFALAIHEHVDLAALLPRLRAPLVATALDGASDLYRTALPERCAWCSDMKGRAWTRACWPPRP